MLQALNFNTEGIVEIYALEADNKRRLLVTKNSLAPTYKAVIANILARTSGANALTEIGLYIGSDTPTARVVRPITTYLLIEPERVQFDAIFEESSFQGTIVSSDITSSIGQFAKITGLSLTKSPTDRILISWKVKIL